MSKIYLSEKSADRRIESRLRALLSAEEPGAVGVATAFLSMTGARKYHRIVKDFDSSSRVVAGLSGGVTHPSALRFLLENGHEVRLGEHSPGIFHPKLLVAGQEFLRTGRLVAPVCGYVGSANFTSGGLERNLEIMMSSREEGVCRELASAFQIIWKRARTATSAAINQYERSFERMQKKRALADLELLGVIEPQSESQGKVPLLIPLPFATAVWVGLQSFTGDSNLQVEFPKKVGQVLYKMLGSREGTFSFLCSDSVNRDMIYTYRQNSMYRLNVPIETPGAAIAKTSHAGILLVSRDEGNDATAFRVEVLRGRPMKDVISRSQALGTIGNTLTRQYGWY